MFIIKRKKKNNMFQLLTYASSNTQTQCSITLTVNSLSHVTGFVRFMHISVFSLSGRRRFLPSPMGSA